MILLKKMILKKVHNNSNKDINEPQNKNENIEKFPPTSPKKKKSKRKNSSNSF